MVILLSPERSISRRGTVSKQADFAMLLYLFRPGELMRGLGCNVDRAALHRSIEFAFQHTSHGSSLSEIVYAGAFAHFDSDPSWPATARVCNSN